MTVTVTEKDIEAAKRAYKGEIKAVGKYPVTPICLAASRQAGIPLVHSYNYLYKISSLPTRMFYGAGVICEELYCKWHLSHTMSPCVVVFDKYV